MANVLDRASDCIEAADSIELSTQCLYPSFEPVRCRIRPSGRGFRVDDDGGAARVAWLHSRRANISELLRSESGRYRVHVTDTLIHVEVPSSEWLPSAIMAVSNASAAVARAALDKVNSPDNRLHGMMDTILRAVAGNRGEVRRNFDLRGASGKVHKFDFGLTTKSSTLVVDAISPHHNAIANCYVAFSDIGQLRSAGTKTLGVFDQPLQADDLSLLLQVTPVVAITELGTGAEGLMN